MTGDTATMTEAESDRQELLRQIAADTDKSPTTDFSPGSFGCHELLDRTALLAKLVEEQIVEHLACVQQPGWFALAHEATAILNRLYQEIGRSHLDR